MHKSLLLHIQRDLGTAKALGLVLMEDVGFRASAGRTELVPCTSQVVAGAHSDQGSLMPGSHRCSVAAVLSPQRLLAYQEPATASWDGGPCRLPVQHSLHQAPAALPPGFGQPYGGAMLRSTQGFLEDEVSILIDY